jgi:hypothetical protein
LNEGNLRAIVCSETEIEKEGFELQGEALADIFKAMEDREAVPENERGVQSGDSQKRWQR